MHEDATHSCSEITFFCAGAAASRVKTTNMADHLHVPIKYKSFLGDYDEYIHKKNLKLPQNVVARTGQCLIKFTGPVLARDRQKKRAGHRTNVIVEPCISNCLFTCLAAEVCLLIHKPLNISGKANSGPLYFQTKRETEEQK